jgi:ankyrin repeat protein
MTRLVQKITGPRVANLKFVLTSRPYDYVRAEIYQAQRISVERIHLQGSEGPTAEEIVQEIKLVVQSRIEAAERRFLLTPEERSLMQTQFDLVPNRTYLWVSLVFDGLMGEDSEYDPSEGLTKNEILELVRKLPQSIDSAYEKLLNRGHKKEKEKRKMALHLVLAARRPLSLAEMRIALAFTNNQLSNAKAPKMVDPTRFRNYVKNLCGLFISIVDEQVYLLHQTAREFLDPQASERATEASMPTRSAVNSAEKSASHLPADVWKHSMDTPTSSSTVAEACIRYLHSGFANENSALLDYAATNWAHHYHEAGRICQAAVAEMTRDLCLKTESNSKWTSINSIMEMEIPTIKTPLHLASALGLDTAVELFIRDLGINEADFDGSELDTALWLAARFGHDAVVKLLLATKNVDVNVQCQYDETPLSKAAFYGHGAVVELLLAVDKTDVNLKNIRGRTPLYTAVFYRHHTVVKLLVASDKVDINSKDTEDLSAFSYAIMKESTTIVNLLLANDKVDVNEETNGKTQLALAAQAGFETMVKLLLATGKANIDSKDLVGRTPLSLAAESGSEGAVELLLAAKADANLKDEYGRTPLTYATENDHEGVVKLLQSFNTS